MLVALSWSTFRAIYR